jgi:hypothetical protein
MKKETITYLAVVYKLNEYGGMVHVLLVRHTIKTVQAILKNQQDGDNES